jgi:hypothetical protein
LASFFIIGCLNHPFGDTRVGACGCSGRLKNVVECIECMPRSTNQTAKRFSALLDTSLQGMKERSPRERWLHVWDKRAIFLLVISLSFLKRRKEEKEKRKERKEKRKEKREKEREKERKEKRKEGGGEGRRAEEDRIPCHCHRLNLEVQKRTLAHACHTCGQVARERGETANLGA